MNKQIEVIIKEDWYKTATEEEMRIALMHLQQGAMDRLRNEIVNTCKIEREEVFQELANSCNWKK